MNNCSGEKGQILGGQASLKQESSPDDLEEGRKPTVNLTLLQGTPSQVKAKHVGGASDEMNSIDT